MFEDAVFVDEFLPDLLPSKDLSDAPTPTARRKATQRAEGRTGRSAFVAPICTYHPDWEDESGHVTWAYDPAAGIPADIPEGDSAVIHCAKFGHLPGKGRGIYQPSITKSFILIGKELAKPLFFMVAILGFLYGIQYVVSLGGSNSGVLQPGHSVPGPVRSVSVGSRPAPTPTNGIYRHLPLGGTPSPVDILPSRQGVRK